MKTIYILFLLVVSGTLPADEIYLTDNTSRKGSIINVTGDDIEYNTAENTKEKIAREQVEKIVYSNGKEIEFYDKIYLTDGSIVKGKVLKTTGEYLEYNPAGTIPYDKIEVSGIVKILYDSGKMQNFQKTAESDLIYFKDGTTLKASGIVINAKNIEFYDEKNVKQFYGLNLIEKIVYQNGRTEYPERNQPDNKKKTITADKGGAGKPVNSFIELEWGWNGYAGLGARFDYLIFRNISINGAAGLGVWGYRFSGAFRYYTEYPYGLAFSAGVAQNTGGEYENSFDTHYPGSETTYNENVKFKFNPVTCINATLLYSFQVNGNDKFYIETGYSYAIQKEKYTYTTESGRELTDESKDIMDILAPGGFMLSIGYALAL